MRVRFLAVALTSLGVLAAAAPAATQTRESWQGIAVARKGFGVTSVHSLPSKAAAEAALYNDCANAGFDGCFILATSTTCVAAAYSEQGGHYFSAGGATAEEARNAAYAKCSAGGAYCDNDIYACP